MPLQFNCPKCQQRLSIPSAQAGQTMACPHCQAQIKASPLPRAKATGDKVAAPVPPPPPPTRTESAPLVVECQHCRQQFSIAASYAGQQIPCLQCNAPILIGSPPATAAIPPPAFAIKTAPPIAPRVNTSTRPAPDKSPKVGLSNEKLMLIGAGSLVGIAVVGLLVFIVVSSLSKPDKPKLAQGPAQTNEQSQALPPKKPPPSAAPLKSPSTKTPNRTTQTPPVATNPPLANAPAVTPTDPAKALGNPTTSPGVANRSPAVPFPETPTHADFVYRGEVIYLEKALAKRFEMEPYDPGKHAQLLRSARSGSPEGNRPPSTQVAGNETKPVAPPPASLPETANPSAANSSRANSPDSTASDGPSFNPFEVFVDKNVTLPTVKTINITPGSPFVMINGELFEWKTGKSIYKFELDFDLGATGDWRSVAVSPSGKRVAWIDAEHKIAIADVASGTTSRTTLPGMQGAPGRARFVRFATEDLVFAANEYWYLLPAGDSEPSPARLQLADLTPPFDAPREPRTFAADPNSNSFIACSDESIYLFDATSPKSKTVIRHQGNEANNQLSVAYAPEGDEFSVAILNDKQVSIQTYSAQGKLSKGGGVFTDVALDARYFFCLPKKAGWFTGREFLDRDLKQPVLRILGHGAGNHPSAFALDDRHMILSSRFLGEIPRDKIDAAKSQMLKKHNTWFTRPGPIAIEVAGEDTDLRKRSADRIRERLKAAGLTEGPNPKVAIRVTSKFAQPGEVPLEDLFVDLVIDGKIQPGFRTIEWYVVGKTPNDQFKFGRLTLEARVRGTEDGPPSGDKFVFPLFVPDNAELPTLPILLP